ncbi:glucose-6-phosphate dehydrogenase assembly protein OpcA [Longispora albida]|uniref:glucose-6-phosphate dehydrogenase assembly protein OpcA n=1 Tax=Longispora albida TaxID=203523 RepID=UPI00037E61DC|nr:glucose-6-phosphate dehydrogenase assembly protein OpcA [Longispora albida]
MIALWDTTGVEVIKALAAERRSAGGLTSGLALTLIAVVDEKHVREAEAAAMIASQQHPCRLLIIVRRDVLNPESRLDAEIVVGGRLGPCEAIVMRMHGRLALHAESVAMPLLAPDVPVVTWWHCEPPEGIAYDPLGVVADRRITDVSQATAPATALQQRADDYAPGDTDLVWTRLTPWRTLIAGAYEAVPAPAKSVVIGAPVDDPGAKLLAGWLRARLGVGATIRPAEALESVTISLENGGELALERHGGMAALRRTGYPDRVLPLLPRPLGEELAEELRRIDADQPYAAALEAAYGLEGLNERAAMRVHIWHDPAVSEQPEALV